MAFNSSVCRVKQEWDISWPALWSGIGFLLTGLVAAGIWAYVMVFGGLPEW